MVSPLYTPLLTDLYQITMAYGYWQMGMHKQEAAFHLLFRHNPFNNPYAICCGLGSVVDFLKQWRFQEDDIQYLSTLKDKKNVPLFEQNFLNYLRELRFSCNLDAIPEGSLVFAHEPLIRIEGPLLECQLLETALLNMVNFQTLIATKASRVRAVSGNAPVIEFGMRRAQGPDGALSASRAAYIGGCESTSNALAGKLYDIPVRGTHAHSWVTAFSNEQQAFDAYAKIFPFQCILLVDTFDTLRGVKKAIETGKKLRKEGADLLAIRLDSGDMAKLSIEARKLLDTASFQKTHILASNSLDEYKIQQLQAEGARIDAWGVGTNLVTAYDCPALDGVYKLSALQDAAGKWQYKLKISEQSLKVSNPGRHQVRRFFVNKQMTLDVIYDLELGISDVPRAMTLDTIPQLKKCHDVDGFVDLLIPIFRRGKYVAHDKSIHEIRQSALEEVEYFNEITQEKAYAVGLEEKLFNLKQMLVDQEKKAS